MTLLGQQAHTVHRFDAAAYVDRVWTLGAPTVLSITGSLQPLRPHELQLLEEGVRARGAWKLYARASEMELRTASPDGATAADRVLANGRTLEVHGVDDYSLHTGGVAHRRYILVEVGGDEQ